MKNYFKFMSTVVLKLLLITTVNSYAFWGDNDVEVVKDGTFAFDTSITVGDAFDGNQFLRNQKWTSFEDGQKRKYVNFTGEVDVNFVRKYVESVEGSPINAPIALDVQFVINRDKTFNISFLEFTSPIGSLFKPHNVSLAMEAVGIIFKNDIPARPLDRYVQLSKSGVFDAIKEDNIDKIANFLKYGVDVNSIDHYYKRSPLSTAVIYKKVKSADFLINSGADVNFKDSFGDTPIIIASSKDNREIFNLLIDNGADINKVDKEGYTPLLKSLSVNNGEFANILLDHNANIKTVNKYGESAITLAVARRDTNLIKRLCELGADVNHKNKRNESLLGTVLSETDMTIAEILLSYGADINDRAFDGSTLLMWHARLGNEKIVKFLLDNGADTKLKDSAGRDIFSRGNMPQMEQFLRSYTPAPTRKTTSKPSPQGFVEGNYIYKDVDDDFYGSLFLEKKSVNTFNVTAETASVEFFCEVDAICQQVSTGLKCTIELEQEDDLFFEIAQNSGGLEVSGYLQGLCGARGFISGEYELCESKILKTITERGVLLGSRMIDGDEFLAMAIDGEESLIPVLEGEILKYFGNKVGINIEVTYVVERFCFSKDVGYRDVVSLKNGKLI